MENNLWDKFAVADAEHYILTDNRYPSDKAEGRAYFFNSGAGKYHAIVKRY